MVFDVEGILSYEIGSQFLYGSVDAFLLSFKGCLTQTIDSFIRLNFNDNPIAGVAIVDYEGLHVLYLQTYPPKEVSFFPFIKSNKLIKGNGAKSPNFSSNKIVKAWHGDLGYA
jgi:hypothetical protein